jgi:Zn-dependent alcohol dehydrogenase
MIRLHQAGAIDLSLLVTERIGLEDIDDAFAAMDRGTAARSVVVY